MCSIRIFKENLAVKKPIRPLSLIITILMILLMLVACAPAKSTDKAIKALEANGYTAVLDTRVQPAFFEDFDCSLNAVISAFKYTTDAEGNRIGEHVTIYYFPDKANASKAMTKIEMYAREDVESGGNRGSSWVSPKQSGSIIYYGTKAAIKAAR